MSLIEHDVEIAGNINSVNNSKNNNNKVLSSKYVSKQVTRSDWGSGYSIALLILNLFILYIPICLLN